MSDAVGAAQEAIADAIGANLALRKSKHEIAAAVVEAVRALPAEQRAELCGFERLSERLYAVCLIGR